MSEVYHDSPMYVRRGERVLDHLAEFHPHLLDRVRRTHRERL